MANARLVVSKEGWTENDIGGIITAFMGIVNPRGIKITSISLNGPTEYSFVLSEIASYAVFNSFKTDIDSACASLGVTIKEFGWSL